LPPDEFAHQVLIAAAPPNRVGEVVARLVGDEITIGPIPVGPGEMASATAIGKRGPVHVTTCDDPFWDQTVRVPIDLSVAVDLAGRTARFRGAVQVLTRIRLQLERPCTVAVQVDTVRPHNVRTNIEASGLSARVLGCVGGIDQNVADQVLAYVNELTAGPRFEAALHIDVPAMLDRAWEADLVVILPAGDDD
jgi:hypothetical protein